MAKLFLEGSTITEHATVRAYQDMLEAITQDDEVTCENLLSAPRFNATYNNVMTGVSQP